MKRHEVVSGLSTLAGLVLLVGPTAAVAARSSGATRTVVAAGARVNVPVAADALGMPELRLRQAITAFAANDLDGVIARLDPLDYTSPAFAGADRAAYLLAHALHERGAETRLRALAAKIAAWPRHNAYTEGLARIAQTDPSFASDAAGGGVFAGTPLEAWFRFRALSGTAGEEAALDAVLASDTTTVLGRDLYGAAAIGRATRMLQRNEDPRVVLAAVPRGSRYAAGARHMAGLVDLERGDTDRGRLTLRALADSGYARRREVLLAIAGEALDHERWDDALNLYSEIDSDWAGQRDDLEGVLALGDFGELWSEWRSTAEATDVIGIDDRPERAFGARLAAIAADLSATPVDGMAVPTAIAPRPARPWPVSPPNAAAWSEVSVAERNLGDNAQELAEALGAVRVEADRLGDLRRYLAWGGTRTGAERDALAARAARLDSLRATLDQWDERLRGVRDSASARVVQRVTAILERVGDHRLWMNGMRHFHFAGPRREALLATPSGFPRPDSLLQAEEDLLDDIHVFVERLGAEGPGRIARSYDEHWRPGLIDRAGRLSGLANASLAWATAIGGGIDSSVAGSATSPLLSALSARAMALEASVDSMTLAVEALRRWIARDAVVAARSDLEEEREGIDYGLAVASYAASARPERNVASDVNRNPAMATSDSIEAPEHPSEALGRNRAIAAGHAFLERHPFSTARGEMRFRLADLLLVDARQRFRAEMSTHLASRADDSRPPTPLPVLDHAPALALYRAVLAEDHDFPHRDAVLFNAGMILADDGDMEAAGLFGELIAAHPASTYVQEARLRMGDLRFQDRDFGEAIALYRGAAGGPDRGLRAVALYKMGWGHFNQEQWLDAVDAFRAVLDLYGGDERSAILVDVEHEAESDLVQSLARAGGAAPFATYFDRIGSRPYETRVLLALGQHHLAHGLYDAAADVDRSCVERYPNAPEALLSAQRLIATMQTRERPDLARKAQLEYAARFAPGTAWARAQTSDSLRGSGSGFARTALLSVATHHHREGRRHDHAADWHEARTRYEQVIAQWPEHPETASLELLAGEASAKLGESQRALEHYAVAARSKVDSVASEARWQRVVVTDAWYESTRSATGSRRGDDSLARAVMSEGEALIQRHPNHAQGANLLWRQGHLAFAHEWFDRAAAAFELLATAYKAERRAPDAASLRAEALYRLGDYEAAGAAFEKAEAVAVAAGRDSLARRASAATPVSYYRLAESVATTDSSNHVKQAELFGRVAERWPQYENSHVAQYRTGLAWLAAGRRRESIEAMEGLVARFPNSEYVRDARLQIAQTWEAIGERERAATAYLAFASAYLKDDNARPAWLRSGELLEAAGMLPRADEVRLEYMGRWPGDHEAAMEILAGMATRELATVGSGHPVSSLLPRPRRRGDASKSPPPSRLGQYMGLAGKHPDLASRELLAQVKFLQGEEAGTAFAAARLTQPLDAAIASKQKRMEETLSRYREAIDKGASIWAAAAAYRIGETLIGFGDALQASERPADLTLDDLRAYEQVLGEQAQTFHDRGEDVWEQLLRQRNAGLDGPPATALQDGGKAEVDPWVSRAQSGLWQRLGVRFAYRPEFEFPVVEGDKPARVRPAKAPDPSRDKKSRKKSRHEPDTKTTSAAQEDGR